MTIMAGTPEEEAQEVHDSMEASKPATRGDIQDLKKVAAGIVELLQQIDKTLWDLSQRAP